MTFTDVWKLPFKMDEGGYITYIYDSNNHLCFNFLSDDEMMYSRVLGLLNGDTANNKPFDNVKFIDEVILVSDGKEDLEQILLVRGFGYLTGTGGLNIGYAKAIKIQDELIEYCANKLMGK